MQEHAHETVIFIGFGVVIGGIIVSLATVAFLVPRKCRRRLPRRPLPLPDSIELRQFQRIRSSNHLQPFQLDETSLQEGQDSDGYELPLSIRQHSVPESVAPSTPFSRSEVSTSKASNRTLSFNPQPNSGEYLSLVIKRFSRRFNKLQNSV